MVDDDEKKLSHGLQEDKKIAKNDEMMTTVEETKIENFYSSKAFSNDELANFAISKRLDILAKEYNHQLFKIFSGIFIRAIAYFAWALMIAFSILILLYLWHISDKPDEIKAVLINVWSVISNGAPIALSILLWVKSK